MKMIKSFYAAAALAGALVAMPTVAATPIVSGGKLMGASGVIVGGASYDVSFLDGSCASVFGGCSTSNFTFTTVATAFSAGNALLSQVFINGSAGKFDTHPELTNGCNNSIVCNVLIPYEAGKNIALVDQASNNFFNLLDFNSVTFIGTQASTSSLSTYVFAKFTPTMTAAVPEPTTWAMMLAGFGMMGAALRSRKRFGKFAFA